MPTPPFILELREKVGTALLHVPTVAVLTYDEQGRVLLVRNAGNRLWSTPGGILEPHESPADAAVRETWEETGLLVELVRVAGVFGGEHCGVTYANGDRITWVATLFEARRLRGELRPDGEEVAEARYVAPGEIAALPCRPHLPMFLEAGRRHEGGAWFAAPRWKPPA
jgi:ADP-ribose pyrophosphatase YjhB (NUDIX family)